jgi:ABC-2 type transport system ATP-binding protein
MNSLTESDIQAPPLDSSGTSQDEIIRLESVSVQYRTPHERIGTFKEYFIQLVRGRIRFNTFWALHDVDLSILRGEVFGVIGRNGAGKSTLLKVISRVLRPTKGRIVIYGKVAPLLDIGAGFHPELSGRENVYLNGALLGYSGKEMDACYDQIVDFSELGEFMDAPIRTYSSGMYARLGFAVATAHVPDILLVDEILSVGDEAFQHKCFQRISEFKKLGATIVLVSHNLAEVESSCQRVAWLDQGRIHQIGAPGDVIKAYRGV